MASPANVVCLVVFYDKNGNPLESDIVRSYGVIGPGLAERVSRKVDPSVKRLTTEKLGYLKYAFRPTTRLEFRILDFKIAG